MKFLAIFLLCLSNQIKIANGQSPPFTSDSNPIPTVIDYIPTSFSNKFSLNTIPVLHLHSGDTVRTETIDATGRDKAGVKRQKGGNPLTGPFYIDNSNPGDVLQIRLIKISLNRSYAYTTEAFVSRSMPDSISRQFKKLQLVKWKLEMERGFAYPDSSLSVYDNLRDFKIPLNPFLGCIGVAPSNKNNEILSFFQGNFGGNLDFSGIRQGSTVYLPVLHEGGYFYIGDGHAVQGDGEIAGNALETSLDVVFSITLIKKNAPPLKYPRVEDSSYIMVLGSNKKLDNAVKTATYGLLEWLQNDYHVTMQEATQIMSTGIEYAIAEIADPEVIVVAKIKKQILLGLRKPK